MIVNYFGNDKVNTIVIKSCFARRPDVLSCKSHKEDNFGPCDLFVNFVFKKVVIYVCVEKRGGEGVIKPHYRV